MNGAAVIQPSPIPFYTVLVRLSWNYGSLLVGMQDVRRIALASFFVLSGKAGVLVSGIAYSPPSFLWEPSWYTGNHLWRRLCRNGYLCTWSCVLYDSSGSSYWP